MMEKATEVFVSLDGGEWAPFPTTLSKGGISWKLLHVSPEMGSWAAAFECPAGSSFNAHFHTGPGEYFLYKGRMDVRGGASAGGDTAIAPGYGYESSAARHDRTSFPVESGFFMTFLGPLAFLNADGSVSVNIGWSEAQAAWQAHIEAVREEPSLVAVE